MQQIQRLCSSGKEYFPGLLILSSFFFLGLGVLPMLFLTLLWLG